VNYCSHGSACWSKCGFPKFTDLICRKDCDPALEEAVKTIIYAAPRSESKELLEVLDILYWLTQGTESTYDAVR
jgi:Regulator of Vps4 activity in the MVB pathway